MISHEASIQWYVLRLLWGYTFQLLFASKISGIMKKEELGRLMCIPADASKDDVKMRFVQIAEIIKNYCVIKFKNQRIEGIGIGHKNSSNSNNS